MQIPLADIPSASKRDCAGHRHNQYMLLGVKQPFDDRWGNASHSDHFSHILLISHNLFSLLSVHSWHAPFLFRQFIWNLSWQHMWLFEFNCACVCEWATAPLPNITTPTLTLTALWVNSLKVIWTTLPSLQGEVKFFKLLSNRTFLALFKTIHCLCASWAEKWQLKTCQSIKTGEHSVRKSVWLMQGRKWNQIQFSGLKEWRRGWNWHPGGLKEIYKLEIGDLWMRRKGCRGQPDGGRWLAVASTEGNSLKQNIFVLCLVSVAWNSLVFFF